MYHSITFGDKNTWDDWHLIPSERPSVVPPPVVTKFVDIPGMDGSLDLTEALVGRPTYGRRSGKWKFILANDYGEWQIRYSTIMNYLHGQEMEVRLEDDPDYFYFGRLDVEEFKTDPDQNWSTITIEYNLMPFKYDLVSSIDDWIWDTFNFETGVIRDYRSLAVNGSLSIMMVGSEIPLVPDIILSEGMTVEYNGVTVVYDNAGTYHAIELAIVPGDHEMTFTGTGIVTVYFRGGSF